MKQEQEIKPKEYWIDLFKKDNLIDTKKWKDTIPALLLIGAFNYGTTEEAKKKIMKWMGLEYVYGQKQKVQYFFRCWQRLVDNGVFKDGKVYADLEDDIEFVMLILIAQGLVRRDIYEGEE